ncbi:hypothetical protein [Fulvivirga lutea]|uniref:Uncharacterized protein n=1 Tax=Fulvivirga lutea TaxID=2810512 RepID=A0A974ZZY2_9BACT|nr:hypothetical protein [Fulvivirga lutea]QSE95892.1 hypothetical protein JR347_09690 [Fulvivirga lutea]
MNKTQQKIQYLLNEVLDHADKKVDSLQMRIVNASEIQRNSLIRAIAKIRNEKEIIENSILNTMLKSENWEKTIEKSERLIHKSKAKINRLCDEAKNPIVN